MEEPPPEKMTKFDYLFIGTIFLSGAVYMAWLTVDW
jgi:hypothetical protein